MVQDLLWGLPLLTLLLGVAVYFTFCLRFLQVRSLRFSLKQLFVTDGDHSGDLSPFNALMTSLAGAIGTGTIVGVGSAIAIGGLGSLFWMWVMAFFGMALKFAESHLAVYYRVMSDDKEMCGGPMHYMEKGLGWKKGAMAFAVFGVFAALTTGNLVQANAIKEALDQVFALPVGWIALSLTIVTGTVVIGGVKSIGKVAGILVPVMAALYLGAGAYILLGRFSELPATFALIIRQAFFPEALLGGMGGSLLVAFQMGVARSLFSSEAGLGISSIASASAKTDHPVRQALVSMTGVFFSTLLICTMTGLVVALHIKELALLPEMNPARMVMVAFESSIPYGSAIVSVGLIFFAYSTIIAWGYYGEKCAEYLFGTRVRHGFRILFTLALIPGVMLPLCLVWQLADIANACMTIPNVLALFMMSPLIIADTRQFFAVEKQKTSLSLT